MADFRYLLAIYVHAHQTGNSVPPHIDAEARAALAAPPAVDGPAVPQEGREPAAVVPDIRGLIERVARMADRIGLATVREIMEISDQAAAWLQENPPGHSTAPAPVEGEVGELVAKLRRLSPQNPLGTADPTITRAAALLQQQAAELARLRAGVVPVAVSERLPGEGDCDAEGRCWLLTIEDEYPQWRLHSIEGHQPGGRMILVPVDRTPGVMVDAFYVSHWLPAQALPLPAPQGGEVQP